MNTFAIIAITLSQYSINPEDSIKYKDQKVEVCGDLVSIKMPEHNKQPHVISMEGKMNIVIWDSDIKNIEIAPDSLVGDKVCVTGIVSVYDLKPQITLKKYDQIKIIEAKDKNN